MNWSLILHPALALLPVLTMLGVFILFDTFKLLRVWVVLRVIMFGAIVGVAAAYTNLFIRDSFNISEIDYVHFGAPFIEEFYKATIIFFLIVFRRIGFAFDAAILGLASGAGFAVIENIFYLYTHNDQDTALWVVRGFGTAIMHGGTTAIYATVGHVLTVRDGGFQPLKYGPGLALAIALHMAFNFFTQHTIAATLVMLVGMPTLIMIILRRDQKSIQDWVEVDFEAHQKLLDDIKSGDFEKTRAGRFLQRLHDRYDTGMVSKIVYYLQIHTELIIEAETILQAHGAGHDTEISHETKEKLLMLRELELEIGKTAVLALRSHLHFNRHEFWEIYMLEKEAGFKHATPH